MITLLVEMCASNMLILACLISYLKQSHIVYNTITPTTVMYNMLSYTTIVEKLSTTQQESKELLSTTPRSPPSVLKKEKFVLNEDNIVMVISTSKQYIIS